jgi:hypothetical protein
MHCVCKYGGHESPEKIIFSGPSSKCGKNDSLFCTGKYVRKMLSISGGSSLSTGYERGWKPKICGQQRALLKCSWKDSALGQATQESTPLVFYILQQAVSSLKWDFPAPMSPAVTWSLTWLSPLIPSPLSFSHLVIVQDWYVGRQRTVKQKESIYLKNLNQEYCVLGD